jgi:hypothetical protein
LNLSFNSPPYRGGILMLTADSSSRVILEAMMNGRRILGGAFPPCHVGSHDEWLKHLGWGGNLVLKADSRQLTARPGSSRGAQTPVLIADSRMLKARPKAGSGGDVINNGS